MISLPTRLKKQLTPYIKWKWLHNDGNTLQQTPERQCKGESNQKKISFETSHEFRSLFCAHRLWPVRAASAGAATNFQVINEATKAGRWMQHKLHRTPKKLMGQQDTMTMPKHPEESAYLRE